MCEFTYAFTRRDSIAAANQFGVARIDEEPIGKSVKCFLPDDSRHDDMPHLIKNPWTGVVHAFIVAFALFLSLAAHAQNAAHEPQKPEAPKAPVISDVVQKNFFKAQAEYANAGIAAKQADDAVKPALDNLNVAIKAMQDACGPLWQAELDKDKNPFCGDKPAPVKPVEKK